MKFWALVLVLSASVVVANKPVKPADKKDSGRVMEMNGNKMVEKIRDRKVSNGKTNDVWKAGRSFPVMFKTPGMVKKSK